LRLGGLAAWFGAKKLHGVRLFVFTHFLGRANQTCCDEQSDSGCSAQSLAYAQSLLGGFIVVLRQ
jgi:hypothetical protein